jgi:hypothetical protein
MSTEQNDKKKTGQQNANTEEQSKDDKGMKKSSTKQGHGNVYGEKDNNTSKNKKQAQTADNPSGASL